MVYVAVMTVRRKHLTEFGCYEQGAAAVAARHGGTTVRVDSVRPELVTDVTTRICVLRFPSVEAYQAYTKDPDLIALDPLRHRAIARLDIYTGNDRADDQGPDVKARAAH
jgi:uncharacterized protein (DUF1330 family)